MSEAVPRRIVLATANPGKAEEIAALLGPSVELVPRPDSVPDVEEDDDTLEGNARLKALAIVEATGEAALADDTGLEVDALGGAPGVHSARYAGPEADSAANRRTLLDELERVGALEPAARTARFRTVLVLRHPDGTELVVDGIVEGHILTEERGEGGFGYDALFAPVDDPAGRSFAEMSLEEKNAISHRGRALRTLAARLGD
jgi:XTP/dITP diphosphohydrolase